MNDPLPYDRLVRQLDRLPLIDSAVRETLDRLDDPESTYAAIADTLTPEVAVRFLSEAAANDARREVRSMQQAMVRLGYRGMRQVLENAIGIDHFTGRLDGFQFERFQIQSRLCAAAAEMIGYLLDFPHPEDLHTAAILHNIGKLVIAVYFPQEHDRIVALKTGGGISTGEAERQVLGADHAEIGAALLIKFGIHPMICDAVRFHNHNDTETLPQEHRQATLIVRSASRLVGRLALPEDLNPRAFFSHLAESLSISRGEVRLRMRDALQQSGYQDIFPRVLADATRQTEALIAAICNPREESADTR